MENHKYDIGLVLSGGGSKGMGHIGVIKAMEDLGIEANVIAGTSAGSIVGSLYAAGKTADEMLEYFLKVSLFKIKHYAWSKPGVIDTEKFKQELLGLLDVDYFEDLQKPMHIVATDLLAAKEHSFTTGELVPAIMASSAFPVLFSPVEFNNTYYTDGGIVNNFPTKLLRAKCKHLIGVHVLDIRSLPKEKMNSTLSVIQRIYTIMTRMDATRRYNDCDVVIAPQKLDRYRMFEMSKLFEMYEIGYEEAIRQLENYFK